MAWCKWSIVVMGVCLNCPWTLGVVRLSFDRPFTLGYHPLWTQHVVAPVQGRRRPPEESCPVSESGCSGPLATPVRNVRAYRAGEDNEVKGGLISPLQKVTVPKCMTYERFMRATASTFRRSLITQLLHTSYSCRRLPAAWQPSTSSLCSIQICALATVHRLKDKKEYAPPPPKKKPSGSHRRQQVECCCEATSASILHQVSSVLRCKWVRQPKTCLKTSLAAVTFSTSTASSRC